MSWAEGYVADAEYTSNYYAELAPPHLDFAMLSAGIMPPDREGGRFRYCELGCGNGMSTNILAACHPNAEFVGIDFMPTHIANSRHMAKKANLSNVQFYELSFSDACQQDFEPFDYIVAHGIYSWIMPEHREDMIEFYRRFLAPGGVVYLSYNTYPGWLPVAPVQKLVSEFANTLKGPSPQRVRKGFDFASDLLAKNAVSLQVLPGAKQQIERAPTQPPNYLAHEYLNEAWYPSYVTDVMRELSAAKLQYVASATLAENDLRFLVSDELAAVIREQPTEELRQLVKDISINARFRRDIYTRGGRRLSSLDQRQLLSERSFALLKSPESVTYKVEYSGRSVGFDTPIARKIVEALASGHKTLGELTACCDTSDKLRSTVEIVTILCIGGHAIAVDTEQTISPKMNKALSAAAIEDTACNSVASTFGTGIVVTQLELALLNSPENFTSVETAIGFLKAFASRKGRVFNKGGKALTTETELDEFLSTEVSTVFSNRLPAFRMLGLLPKS